MISDIVAYFKRNLVSVNSNYGVFLYSDESNEFITLNIAFHEDQNIGRMPSLIN